MDAGHCSGEVSSGASHTLSEASSPAMRSMQSWGQEASGVAIRKTRAARAEVIGGGYRRPLASSSRVGKPQPDSGPLWYRCSEADLESCLAPSAAAAVRSQNSRRVTLTVRTICERLNSASRPRARTNSAVSPARPTCLNAETRDAMRNASWQRLSVHGLPAALASTRTL